jgi:DNA invertase Pin-like site-specific DNA recombinase
MSACAFLVYDCKVSSELFTGVHRNIGYVRVSKSDQSLDLQMDALLEAGCKRRDIYADHGVSGKVTQRPQLDKCLAALSEGDALVVWKLDRLGRSLKHLIEVVNDLHDRGVGFKSVTEGMDTTTNQGRLVFHMFGALAEFERGLIVERTMAGIIAARSRGVIGGRQPVLDAGQAALAKDMINRGMTVSAVARALKVARPTIYRVIEMSDRELRDRDERAAARLRANSASRRASRRPG